MRFAFAALFALVASAASAQSPRPVVTDAEMKTYLTEQSTPTLRDRILAQQEEEWQDYKRMMELNLRVMEAEIAYHKAAAAAAQSEAWTTVVKPLPALPTPVYRPFQSWAVPIGSRPKSSWYCTSSTAGTLTSTFCQ